MLCRMCMQDIADANVQHANWGCKEGLMAVSAPQNECSLRLSARIGAVRIPAQKKRAAEPNGQDEERRHPWGSRVLIAKAVPKDAERWSKIRRGL